MTGVSTPVPFTSAVQDLTVPAELAEQRLDQVLRALSGATPWSVLRRAVTTGKVSVDGSLCLDPASRVRAGSVLHIDPRSKSPPTSRSISSDRIVFLDQDVVVVRKPAGVSTVPFERGEQGTLVEMVQTSLGRRAPRGHSPASLGVVHRLDKETSGLLVFARNFAAKRELAQQFRFHRIERRYLALALGQVAAQTLKSRLVADRGDGRRGSTNNPKLGRLAVTHVRPIQAVAAATLVECRLETGRTHQIRIHLAEAGHPLYGEKVYAPKQDLARLSAPRLMLHATALGFTHPRTGEFCRFQEPLPIDMRTKLEQLGMHGPW